MSCPPQHRQEKPIRSYLLDTFDLNDFDEKYQDVIPRLLFIEATNEIPNVDLRHFKTEYLDEDYCDEIVDALGWEVDMTKETQKKNCKNMIGKKFTPTISEIKLELIEPHAIQTQFDHLGKFKDICKNIETNPLSVKEDILIHLMNNEFWQPYLELLDLFDVRWTVREMYQYFELLTWFGHETIMLLRCIASEHLKMQVKQQLQVMCYFVQSCSLLVLCDDVG